MRYPKSKKMGYDKNQTIYLKMMEWESRNVKKFLFYWIKILNKSENSNKKAMYKT